MEQKTIWMRYLTFGLIISSILLFISCRKTHFLNSGEFVFVNKTNYNITYDQVNLQKFNVVANGITVFPTSFDGGKDLNPASYLSPLMGLNSGLVNIQFGANKCLLKQNQNSENSILNIKSFVSEKLGIGKYKFTYTFTDADYNRAVTCP